MGYTRNFEYRVHPRGGQRAGRYAAPTGIALPLGVPVQVDTSVTVGDLGLQPVKLATAATMSGAPIPVPGVHGVLDHEPKGDDGWAGVDPYLTTFSDIDTVPVGKACIVVSGKEVKVALRNTTTATFLNTRSYTGRIMVSQGGGSTPNISVGQFLSPGVGDDTSGYWAVTAVQANAWLVVTKVDSARGEVEARMVF